MPTAQIEPKGILILHPALWPKMGWTHPRCDSGCGLEIFPLTPVELEILPNGQILYWHAQCWEDRQKGELPPPAI